jgi:4-diphosphocytidyl-2-C-methyl-D-erythritol kinase
MSAARRARVSAFAKINLDLRVLCRRPDDYHELRTVFQTISLADEVEVGFTPAPRTRIEVEGAPEIEDNLVNKAAALVLDAAAVTGEVRFRLAKRIPMGAGLGGGSSDAAAVLLALPVLAGVRFPIARLAALGGQLGSDVPFFLLGGTAVGLGRGTELYPLPDSREQPGLLVTPRVHSSTAEAYRALSPGLTTETQQNKMFNFQSLTWSGDWGGACNDFETVVFERHPELSRWKSRLERAGARPALMTGSGSALFGLFRARKDAASALELLGRKNAQTITLVSRARYRAAWRRSLKAHITEDPIWPPLSRYVR